MALHGKNAQTTRSLRYSRIGILLLGSTNGTSVLPGEPRTDALLTEHVTTVQHDRILELVLTDGARIVIVLHLLSRGIPTERCRTTEQDTNRQQIGVDGIQDGSQLENSVNHRDNDGEGQRVRGRIVNVSNPDGDGQATSIGIEQCIHIVVYSGLDDRLDQCDGTDQHDNETLDGHTPELQHTIYTNKQIQTNTTIF